MIKHEVSTPRPFLIGSGRAQYRTVHLWVVSACFAFAHANVPWENLNGVGFPDIEAYLLNAQDIAFGFEKTLGASGIWAHLNYEYGWNFLLLYSTSLGAELLLFRAITVFVVFNVFLFVWQRSNIYFAFFVCLNPLIIDLAHGQLRSALALSLLLLAISLRNRYVALLLIPVAISVHLVALLAVASLVAARVYSFVIDNKSSSFQILWFISCLAGVVVYSVMREAAESAIGGERFSAQGHGSGVFFTLVWGMSIFFLMVPSRFTDGATWIYLLAMMFLILFVGSAIMDIYSSRFLAMAFPLLALSFWSTTGVLRQIVMAYLVLLQALQLFYWIQ